MNYIHKLQAENAALQAKLDAAAAELLAMKMHLASDKFQGVDSKGERLDWIATGDVAAFIYRVEGLL